jgi:hypothetical protein
VIEEWRAIPGHEGAYEVSSLGRVRSLDRDVWLSASGRKKGHFIRVKGQILRPVTQSKYGHQCVSLSGRLQFGVHVLVALAFLGPRPAGKETAHKDGDPTNNRLENLAYKTSSDNNYDASRHDRRKIKKDVVWFIKEFRHLPLELTASLTRVSVPHVKHIRDGRRRAHG